MMLFSGQLLSFAQTLKKALKMDPANYELSFFLGEFFHDYNQEECIEYLEQTLRYQPNHYDAHLMLAISYHTEDKLKPAYKHFESARKLNPRARTPLVGLGSLMLTRRKHEQALELLQEANAIREDAYTHYLIGVAFSELGRQGKAITHLEKAIQMDPDREEFHYRLGIVCLERGWTRRAKKALAMANELNPNKIEYQEALNWANEKRVQTEDVLDLNDWQQALEALNLMSKKRLKQALPVLRQLSDKYNRNSIVALGLAALYTALQRWRPAQELIGTIKSSAGSDLTRSLAYLLQVETLRKQERHEEALEVLKELESAITSFYATTIVNYNRALCLADLSRDLDEAERLAKTALERTPPEFRAKVLDALGWVYYKKGHMEEALKTLEESLSLKETKSTLTHMSLTMIALDLNEQATKIFQRLIQYAKMDPLIDPFTMKYLLDRVQDQINAFDPPSP
jgi:tetratricopeptide (TPR) repeat protein